MGADQETRHRRLGGARDSESYTGLTAGYNWLQLYTAATIICCRTLLNTVACYLQSVAKEGGILYV